MSLYINIQMPRLKKMGFPYGNHMVPRWEYHIQPFTTTFHCFVVFYHVVTTFVSGIYMDGTISLPRRQELEITWYFTTSLPHWFLVFTWMTPFNYRTHVASIEAMRHRHPCTWAAWQLGKNQYSFTLSLCCCFVLRRAQAVSTHRIPGRGSFPCALAMWWSYSRKLLYIWTLFLTLLL